MDHKPKTWTKTLINPAQILLILQLPVIDQNLTKYYLKNHTTTSILWETPMIKINLIDAHEEHNIEDAEEELLFEDTNKITITEEELEKIHPYLDHNFKSPTMNTGTITVHYNDPEKFIDNTKYFCQYCSWLLSGNKGNTIQTNATQVSTAHKDEQSNSHVFIYITMFIYIRPVKCDIQIINVSKDPAKDSGIVIVKIPKTNIIIPLWQSYYMPENPQNTISQTSHKH